MVYPAVQRRNLRIQATANVCDNAFGKAIAPVPLLARRHDCYPNGTTHSCGGHTVAHRGYGRRKILLRVGTTGVGDRGLKGRGG
jgi:hypothetical protein